ncbi:MAG: hypothetical protein JST20_03180 [Bacteroidetes bacterium]|nr:hypothetical protein [Bacteroidota bacterium]
MSRILIVRIIARFTFVCLLVFTVISLYSCDRFRDKWERRERKLHYLEEEIDSARKLENHFQDSVWRALDSAKEKQK